MRNHATLAAVGLLAAMGVLVDFASALLSRMADGLFLGAAAYFAYLLLKSKEGEITKLKAEVTALKMIERSRAFESF